MSVIEGLLPGAWERGYSQEHGGVVIYRILGYGLFPRAWGRGN